MYLSVNFVYLPFIWLWYWISHSEGRTWIGIIRWSRREGG